MQQRRVVVTGLGAVTPLGNTVDEFWAALMEGRSGVASITRFDPFPFDVRIGAEVKGFEPTLYMDRKEARRQDRFVQFAVAAARMAVDDARLEVDGSNAEQVGVLIGSGIGGIDTWEDQVRVLVERGPGRMSPFFIPMVICDMASGQVSIMLGAQGPNLTIATACATGNHAIGEACEIIRRGDADVMVAGGSEAGVTPSAVGGFAAMKALSARNEEPERASRPFDAGRDGFVVGEGAGIVILEEMEFARRRGARAYAELVGYGMTGDAHHITQPAPCGAGAARAMRRALHKAGLSPDAVQYINAHGTSTPAGDIAETEAIKEVFGPWAFKVAVSSTKSMHGHLLGAAGGVEFIATVLTLTRGAIPPTINLDDPDPQCDLDFVPQMARPADVRVAMTNSFGFGGHNATLIVKAME